MREAKREEGHPHASAEYVVFQQKDLTFGVRVSIPDSYPTTVTSFASEAAASAWIAAHKEKVKTSPGLRRARTPDFAGSRGAPKPD